MQNQVNFFQALLLVFFGGGIGSVCRFLVSRYTAQIIELGKFPLSTFIANILGSFLIGFLMAKLTDEPNHPLKFLLMVGFCGGFTTFSTFSIENYNLWISQHYSVLFFNIFLSLFLGISAVFLGFLVGR
ncbi:MAG: fluoride efflux transporter CrcB [Cloacibacterium sp.]|nr:fluoride efflux transporter CrcB [Cloacibacterium sp.]